MTFFDKKQDVLKIELTPYGRSLLSNGRLMPKYYAFFDDDIVYDIETIGSTENQTEIKTRILEQTPRLRPQRDLTSPEKLVSNYERAEDSTRPYSKMHLNYLTEPIGTSDGTEEDASSWNFTAILGEIDTIEQYLNTSGSYLRQIPQINMNLEYTMQVRNVRDDSPVTGQAISSTAPVSRTFEDGTYLEILEEQIIARIIEENGFKLKEGLELEAYMFEEDGETLVPLKITPKTKSIIDGILIDEEDNYIEVDKSYLEYYLSVFYDEDIPDSEICKGVAKLKKEDILLDVDVDCPDKQGIDFDIYRTRVTDVEKC
tara:strand:- start:7679 stop:8623 length:945 start_codon:yes stop_codon:yes gene_type:complete